MRRALAYTSCSMSVILMLTVLHCHAQGKELFDEAKMTPHPVSEHTIPLGELASYLKPDTSEVSYKQAGDREAEVFGKLVPRLLHVADAGAPELGTWNALARAVGYTLERWIVGADVYLVLRELPDQRRGGGTYVFRPVASAAQAAAPGKRAAEPDPPVPMLVLQAPHIYFDIGTDELAIHAFFEAPYRQHIRALYLNSLHRFQISPDKRSQGEKSPADACHNARHLYNTVTRLTARHAGPLYVVQIHGFEERENEGILVDVVVSTTKTALTDQVASALAQRFEKRDIRRYPDEFAELGGDTNKQRKLLAGFADAAFVHIEMSRSFRRFLQRRTERRDHFTVALVESTIGALEPDTARKKP